MDSYCFVQLADCQFGMLGDLVGLQWLRNLRALITYGSCGFVNGRDVLPIPYLGALNVGQSAEELYELELLFSERAVEKINGLRPRPAFAVVCGDLVNAYPMKDPAKNSRQVADFKRVYSKLDGSIKLVCVCGNHDVGEDPDKKSIDLYRSRFGADYFTFRVHDDEYIVLNSQYYKNDSRCKGLAKAQDDWLDSVLKRRDGFRHRVVFSHIPPFIEHQDEASGYFPLSRDVRLDLLGRMSHGDVSHWFCGHYHRNSFGVYSPGDGGRAIEVVTTAAIGGNITTDKSGDKLGLSGMESIVGDPRKSGFRVVRVSASGITHEFQTLE
mmetsp:Transcript_17505/g.28331  ORF Transcript_17505/g.28331 Transcript_17505/m.28331 type:complete len:325 (+) Transcript_17505:21-995(+)|eukprot:CAMPEP_0203783216 /NCGR_PEP_ID=MMETSP0099_2-20121227/11553_1 /ASSEMBLY_ACC=CAM_ASM_000209 /TAXON_ID=96639 /ORGANISM=" , Strain NY0313808BC1" /LENGTH=324 /DNA_ID=CAMNT_0050685059 /DNA_START=26 /DNA_END=1000 /DNA_ORIENTATION=-